MTELRKRMTFAELNCFESRLRNFPQRLMAEDSRSRTDLARADRTNWV